MGYIAPAILGFGIGLGINKVIRTVAGEAYPDLKDYTTPTPLHQQARINTQIKPFLI